MPVKLIVHNIPQMVGQDEFRSKFAELKGFIDSKLLLGQNNELYGVAEYVNFETADFARKVLNNFVFQGSNMPISIEIQKSQDNYNYYSGNNMNVGHNHMGGNMNFQNPSSNFHYQNQNQNQELEGTKTQSILNPIVQNQYIQHHQQNKQYPIDNQSSHKFNQNPYNIQGQNQIMSNQLQMPIFQQPNPNIIQGNLQPNISMLNPNEGNLHGNMNMPNISSQQNLHPSHNVQHSNMSLSGPSQNTVLQTSNLSSNMPPINDPLHRNIQPGQFIQPNQQFSGPPTNIGNFQNVMNQMPSHQMNQMHHFQSNQGGNIGGGPNSFSPKNLSPEDLILFKTNPSATSSIYVDGIPIDATEREVAHVFRPFPGFQEVRLIKKEAKSGRQFYFCFVDFETSYQSTIALSTLQGYRFDKSDSKGLKISYAFHAPDMKKSSQQQPPNKKFRNNKKSK